MMFVTQSDRRKPFEPDQEIQRLVATVSRERLEQQLITLAVPRHYHAEQEANHRIGDWLAQELGDLGYRVLFQGSYRNVVALPRLPAETPLVLVGAHYDTVPNCPGADDNGSAVVALMECARVVAGSGSVPPIGFVLFNREEDGLLGSREFVAEYDRDKPYPIREVHILEMLGFCSHEEGSQTLPTGLPMNLPVSDRAEFLAVLSNRHSNRVNDRLMRVAATYCPGFSVLGLKVKLGVEQFFPVLHRSDHAPFWESSIPALMWTDTAEFRNPHYHQPSDTVDTIDFDFLQAGTRLLVARVMEQGSRG
ncbi:M28 family peptidase [Acanthopleuribacter pedis]|uniref:M20/M25/M40 family metallo-hydrolase n=1 Tax=Acanthopleuribacter pedis TaxID=442870 RepID=A0A8J7Q7A2_9BACT|nr:M28 family peptidase [Acanthopleuribacter pedis]MBO1318094.1 M20/M25/M40 family metallo-hydrolase [Acanthopleuribacter pedis]